MGNRVIRVLHKKQPLRSASWWLMLLVVLLQGAGCASVRAADSEKPSFADWLQAFRQEARTAGINEPAIAMALANPSYLPDVVALDRRQPEGKMTFTQYQQRVVTPRRIADGRQRMLENRTLLEQAAQQYRVPPQYIVALWGIETDYGRITGSYPVIDALATLAYDGRRADFFRKELLEALRILQEGHIAQERFYGSWAGAMGQCQFMPSSFRAYAADGNADGKKDIWQSQPDIFHSIARYLGEHGWQETAPWSVPLAPLPEGFDLTQASLNITKTATEWQALGLKTADGTPLTGDAPWSLLVPDGAGQPVFLVGNNFKVIMAWNRSFYFATAVGRLADALKSSRP